MMIALFILNYINVDLQLIHDFILILITSFIFGWMFTCIGLPGKVMYLTRSIVTLLIILCK